MAFILLTGAMGIVCNEEVAQFSRGRVYMKLMLGSAQRTCCRNVFAPCGENDREHIDVCL